MISDVLSDAEADIRKYQKQHRDTYEEYDQELKIVRLVMKAMWVALDTPPGSPEGSAQVERILKAIRELDVRPIRAALRS